MKVKVSREAAIELEEAAAWYEEAQVGLGERLIGAFEDALKRLGSPNPPLTPISGKASQFEAKRLILRRFPFSLITLHRDAVIVVAFAHHSRKPGYWQRRVKS